MPFEWFLLSYFKNNLAEIPGNFSLAEIGDIITAASSNDKLWRSLLSLEKESVELDLGNCNWRIKDGVTIVNANQSFGDRKDKKQVLTAIQRLLDLDETKQYLFHATSYLSALQIAEFGVDISMTNPYSHFGQGFYVSINDPQYCVWWCTRKRLNIESDTLLALMVYEQSIDHPEESPFDVMIPQDPIQLHNEISEQRGDLYGQYLDMGILHCPQIHCFHKNKRMCIINNRSSKGFQRNYRERKPANALQNRLIGIAIFD